MAVTTPPSMTAAPSPAPQRGDRANPEVVLSSAPFRVVPMNMMPQQQRLALLDGQADQVPANGHAPGGQAAVHFGQARISVLRCFIRVFHHRMIPIPDQQLGAPARQALRAAGLPVDGVVGPATAGALKYGWQL